MMPERKEKREVIVNDLKGPRKKVVVNNCPKCGQMRNIIKGFGRLTYDRLTGKKPEAWMLDRMEICSKCEHRTFLPVTEWMIEAGLDWVKQKLWRMQAQDLPINHEPGDWDALWCSICKCYIESKIRDDKSECLLKKWLIAR